MNAIMRPLNRLHAVPPELLVTKAIEIMDRENVSDLPVFFGGKLVGVFSPAQLLRFMEIDSGIQRNFNNRAALEGKCALSSASLVNGLQVVPARFRAGDYLEQFIRFQ